MIYQLMAPTQQRFYRPPLSGWKVNLKLPVQSLLSNVSPGTANLLSYLMLVVVAVFLLSGPAIYYIFSRKSKKTNPVEPTSTV